MELINKDSNLKLRIISGTTDQVEAMINLLVPTYVAWQWRWDVVDGHHLVSVVMLLTADLERAMRMQQLAMGAGAMSRPQ